MIYDVDKIKIQFMLDYKKDSYWIPQTSYLNYSPVLQPNTYSLRTISIEKKHPVCYVKLENKWIYNINNKLVFSTLIPDTKNIYGFIPVRIPCVFFIAYVNDNNVMNTNNLFFLYINTKFGTKNFEYLTYNNDTKEIGLTTKPCDITYFKFNQIPWKQFVDETKILPIINNSKKLINAQL